MAKSKKFENKSENKDQRFEKRGGGRNHDRAPAKVDCNYDHIKGNDIAWWNKAADLYERATNIPFARQAGIPMEFGITNQPEFVDMFSATAQAGGKTAGFEGSWGKRTLPLGMVIDYVPTIGVSTDDNSAPNRAFQAMASAIYSKTTGDLPFPQYVLGLMNIAAQSIAQNIALVKRVIDLSYTYEYENNVVPLSLIKMLGVNFQSVVGKQNDVIFSLNDVIRDFNALHFPGYIDTFKRHYSLARNVWFDANSKKAQFIAFRPAVYYAYSDLGNYNGSEYDGLARCVAYPMPYNNSDISATISIIKNQIRCLKNSDDYWKVRGAMARVFDEGAFMTISPYEESTIEFKMSEDILWQIANLDIAGSVLSGTRDPIPTISSSQVPVNGLDITGDPVSNTLISVPKVGPFVYSSVSDPEAIQIVLASSVVGEIKELNSQHENPSKEFVMEATRLQAYGHFSDFEPMLDTGDGVGSIPHIALEACGTEFVVNARIAYCHSDEDKLIPEGAHNPTITYLPWGPVALYAVGNDPWSYDAQTYGTAPTEFFYADSFYHMRPMSLMCARPGVNGPVYRPFMALGSVFNYTRFRKEQLFNLHRAALLSAYSANAKL